MHGFAENAPIYPHEQKEGESILVVPNYELEATLRSSGNFLPDKYGNLVEHVRMYAWEGEDALIDDSWFKMVPIADISPANYLVSLADARDLATFKFQMLQKLTLVQQLALPENEERR